MALDGALAAGGVVMMATANRSSPEFAQGVVDSTANSVQTDVGVAMLIAGLAGLVINVAIAPRAPEPAPLARTTSSAAVHVAPNATLSLTALTIDPS